MMNTNGNGRGHAPSVPSYTGGEAIWEIPAAGIPHPGNFGSRPTSPAWEAPSLWIRRRDLAAAACIAIVLVVLGGMYVSGDLIDQTHAQHNTPTRVDPFAVTPANDGGK